MKEEINFIVPGLPFSSDTVKFDFYVHHYGFSSVYARLISSEKNGEITPVLAESWSNEKSFKKWKFKIRNNIYFSDKDAINTDVIILNFKRMIYLNKVNNSHSGFLEEILGYEKIEHLNDNIEGMKSNGSEIIFEFKKPIPNLLSLLSFGQFGIVHPTMFDHNSGKWLDDKKVIASGPYVVTDWDDDKFVLSRNDLYFAKDKIDIGKITLKSFQILKDKKSLDQVDMFVGDRASLLVDERFEFISSNVNLKIGYLQIMKWNDLSNPLSDIKVRKYFRNKFYTNLGKDMKVTHSFLPGDDVSVNSENDSLVEKMHFAKKIKFTTMKLPTGSKLAEFANKKNTAEKFTDAVFSFNTIDTNVEFAENENEYDFLIKGTGIEAEDYIDTLKIMFLSKEGIQLPDSSGKIKNELLKLKPDLKFINQEIWDQAIVWPLRHYSSGFWFKRDSNIDYSEINIDAPSIDFQFLKWKN